MFCLQLVQPFMAWRRLVSGTERFATKFFVDEWKTYLYFYSYYFSTYLLPNLTMSIRIKWLSDIISVKYYVREALSISKFLRTEFSQDCLKASFKFFWKLRGTNVFIFFVILESLIFFSILSIFSDDNHPTPNNLSFWVLCFVFKCNFRVAFLVSSEYSWILEQKLQHSFLHLLLPEKLLFGIKRTWSHFISDRAHPYIYLFLVFLDSCINLREGLFYSKPISDFWPIQIYIYNYNKC